MSFIKRPTEDIAYECGMEPDTFLEYVPDTVKDYLFKSYCKKLEREEQNANN